MPLPELKMRMSEEDIQTLKRRLREGNYTEKAIGQRLGVPDIVFLDSRLLPQFYFNCESVDDSLSTLIKLFLLQSGLSRREVSAALGRECIAALSLCGILHRESGLFYSNVDLFPCLEQFLFTDHWFTAGQEEGHVYELGMDSYALVRLTHRGNRKNALDLCTGSGVHAIQSAFAGCRSTAIDINPRALQYAKFNAAFNEQDVHILESNLYSELKGQTFDLITVNPPFVPSTDKEMLVHRTPGESGEEVSERLVAGLPEHLEEGGLFSMILNYPIITGDSYLDRLERWIGQDKGWVINNVLLQVTPVGVYIKEHIYFKDGYYENFNEHLESYAKMGIEGIGFANVFIQRVSPDQPNHKKEIRTVMPTDCKRTNFKDWLSTQSLFGNPTFKPDLESKPQFSSYFATLWRDHQMTKGLLEPQMDNFIPGERIDGEQAELLARMDGRTTTSEILEGWQKDGREEEAFYRAFRDLGLNFAIEYAQDET